MPKISQYHNPYFPSRKIRHADLMVKAGFQIDERWYKDGLEKFSAKVKKPTSVTKLIYWKRGEIQVCLFDYQQISLSNLINRVESQAKYWLRKKAKIVFQEEV